MNENKSQYIQKFKDQKCCVLIPTYNNIVTISQVISDVLGYCKDVYVINDGSTDETLSEIEKFKHKVKIISYKKNKGKGYALVSGFRQAYKDGFKYAITIDADGQHFASDLPTFIKKIENEDNAVIIGTRQLKQKNKSIGSNFANKFSNFWFKVETGITMQDTQSGYRLYPLEPIGKMKFHTKKYEFEIEIIVRLSWRGYKIIGVPIDVFYPTEENRVSHFRPFKDFFRISILNTVLVFLAFVFFLPRNIVRKYKNKKIKDIIREDILGKETPKHIIALSIGFGVFIGILPIWGYQLAVGFLLAHLFKLNKGIFFLFANISFPPMIPVILYLSYIFGGFILGHNNWEITMDNISLKTINLKQYLIGAIALAITAGTIFSSVSYLILMITKRIPKS